MEPKVQIGRSEPKGWSGAQNVQNSAQMHSSEHTVMEGIMGMSGKVGMDMGMDRDMVMRMVMVMVMDMDMDMGMDMGMDMDMVMQMVMVMVMVMVMGMDMDMCMETMTVMVMESASLGTKLNCLHHRALHPGGYLPRCR